MAGRGRRPAIGCAEPLARPAPMAFTARSMTVYCIPFCRLVSVQVPDVPTPLYGYGEAPETVKHLLRGCEAYSNAAKL